ncbi:hypothetical protein [Actinomadura rubrisoli]|uniref:hypothetical protein n=1 Tax=Actinomadura rubrisoli TaxID=2530368 RepID=UPI001404C372|nr:hypothetical protein [Actinomadura rubrisoli]
MSFPSTAPLGPRERLMGRGPERTQLLERLTAMRLPDVTSAHPDLAFAALPAALRLPWIDADVFTTGVEVLADRYGDHGITRLLPPARVRVGIHAVTGSPFGGFHYPNQGYRHLQMAAIITAYGDLTVTPKPPGALVALDLLRAYAHDTLHFATFRRYRVFEGGIARVQYGLNARGPDGRSRSRRDEPNARSTRNLGILMEGATDREATAVARTTAERCGITRPGRGIDRLAFGDVTGKPDLGSSAFGTGIAESAYSTALHGFWRDITARYAATLRELGGDEHGELHRTIVSAMISGDRRSVGAWLEQRHGPKPFGAAFGVPRGHHGPFCL